MTPKLDLETALRMYDGAYDLEVGSYLESLGVIVNAARKYQEVVKVYDKWQTGDIISSYDAFQEMIGAI